MKKLLLLIFCFSAITTFSQYSPEQDDVFMFPEKYVRKIERKARKFDNKILKFSLKSFNKFKKLERKLEGKLLIKDSLLAGDIFNNDNNLSQSFQNIFLRKQTHLRQFEFLLLFGALSVSRHQMQSS